MSPNKRKTIQIDPDEESSLKHRRSSLAVNLSYTNLTDSGHGSFKKTHINNKSSELSTNRIQSYNELLKSNDELEELQHFNKSSSGRHSINKISSISCKDDKMLQNVKVRIVDIKHIKKTGTDYEKLRNAILNKTKEIFNKQDECAIKTSLVLENQNNSVNNRDRHQLLTSAVTSNDALSITSEKNTHSDKLSIFSTPVNKISNKKKFLNSSKIIRRKLFECTAVTDCNNVETVAEANDNLKTDMLPSSIMNTNSNSSPIITSSYRKYHASKLSLKNISRIATKSDVQEDQESLSSLSSLNDGIESIGPPILCSTFTEEFNGENKTYNNKNNISNQNTKNKNINVISMDLTSLQGHRIEQGTNICIKEINATSPVNDTAVKSKENSKIQEVKTNSSTEILQSSQHKMKKNINIFTHDNNEKSMEDHELSLNVNTSMDNVNTSINNEVKDQNNSKKLVHTDNEQESITAVRSSLQVNTSLNSTYKHRQSHNKERTKHQTTRKPGQQFQHNEKPINENNDCTNYVEGTPYHVPQRVQSRSQSKYDAVIHNRRSSHFKTIEISNDGNIQEKGKSFSNLRKKSCLHEIPTIHAIMCTGNEKNILHKSVIIGDSPIATLDKEQYKEVIIDDSFSETELNKEETKNNSAKIRNTGLRRNKKKLLPLCENSKLSLSPREELPNILSPKQSLITKKRKKFTKKAKMKKFLQQPLQTQVYPTTSSLEKQNSDSSENDFVDNRKQKKECKKFRKVISKKIIIKKRADSDILKQLENLYTCSDQEAEVVEHRNSLNEFQIRKEATQRLFHKPQKIIIVVTGFSNGDKSLIKNIVKTLGMARIEPNVTRRTTHVVSTGVRTLNLLYGIIRGCWLVTLEWVLKSLEHNGWLNPEQYEMAHFSKAVQENRKDRELFGTAYVPELFATCGFLYIENGTTPSSHILKELIKTAGGRVTENQQSAKIIIGKNGIKESWVLDSITTGDLQPVTQYRKK